MLGDSFVEAEQVGEQERFVTRLASSERRRWPRPLRDHRRWLRWLGHRRGAALPPASRAWPISPDLVLLAFFVGNDVGDNSIEIQLDGKREAALEAVLRPGEDGALELCRRIRRRRRSPSRSPTSCACTPRPTTSWRAACSRSSGATICCPAWRDSRCAGAPALQGNLVYRSRLTDDWRSAWAITETLLGMVHDEATGHGASSAW